MPRRAAKTSGRQSSRRTAHTKGPQPGVFYFGAQYFRPPTPPAKDWDKDFRGMKKCGMNIVRFWCLWSWHEPREGQYDWDDLRQLLDLCHKYDMRAILLIDLESTPEWLNIRHPEAIYEGHDDTLQHPDGFSNHPSGGFPGLNLDYPAVRDAAERWLRAIVRQFKDDPAVIGWEPHNEPIIEPARMKFMDEQVYSYNEPSVEHFRGWLKKKYKTIDKLNWTWSRKYGDWSEIRAPRRIPGGTATDFVDWCLHNTAALTERVRWRVDIMRQEDPDIHIFIHTRAYSGMQGNPSTWGMDDWQLAQCCDTWGGSSFYRRWPDAGYFLNNDALYSEGKGKPFWLSEVQGGAPSGGLGKAGDRSNADLEYTPEHLRLWTLMPVSQGAKGFMYWQYRMERKGQEWGYGLTNIDGSWSARTQVAKECGEFFRKNADLLLEAQVMEYPAAVGYAIQTPMLEFISRYVPWFSSESIMGAYKLTLHQDIPTYFVRLDDEVVDDDYSPFQILSLPASMFISKRCVAKIEKYVRKGGTVVADAGLCEFTSDQFWWSEAVPGEGLDKVFGVKRVGARSHPKAGKTFADTEKPVFHTIRGQDFKTSNLEEWLEPQGAQVIGAWPDGTPAVTINRYGKGKAIYIGSGAFCAYTHNHGEALQSLYRELCAGIYRHAWTDLNETHVRVLKRGSQRIYFVFNYGNRPVHTRLTIPKHRGSLYDLWHEQTVATEAGPQGAVLPLHMQPFETRIFVNSR